MINVEKKVTRRHSTRQHISARINWLLFQLDGAVGNIESNFNRVVNDPARFECIDVQLYKLYDLRYRARRATNELKAIRKEVAEWNRNKTWVD